MKWIQIDRPFQLDANLKEVLHALHAAGFEALIVGGSVRDHLLSRNSVDHDVATSAKPDEVLALFPQAIGVGKAFGVILVNGVEVATFRKDLKYEDHRHPTQVEFTSIEEDARRRDFTVNALYFDSKTQRVLDLLEGQGLADLKTRTLRVIGQGEKRFDEDALRLLRAIRFSVQLGFEIEPETWKSIQKNSKWIRKISAERIRDEIELMLLSPKPDLAVKLLHESSLLKHTLPDLENSHAVPSLWNHSLKLLSVSTKSLMRRTSTLMWALLFHDLGKQALYQKTQGRDLTGHEILGSEIARKACERMRLTQEQTEYISRIVLEHLRFKDVFQMRDSTLLRWVREPHFETLLELHRIDAIATDGNLAFYDFCLDRMKVAKEMSTKLTMIDGDDLIALGLQPGPLFAQILRSVEDEVLESRVRTKEEALDFVMRQFVK